MKTSHLQSMQARIAAIITFYHAEAHEHRANACCHRDTITALKATTSKQDRIDAELSLKRFEHKAADNYIRSIKKLVPIQKAIKQELRHVPYTST